MVDLTHKEAKRISFSPEKIWLQVHTIILVNQ